MKAQLYLQARIALVKAGQLYIIVMTGISTLWLFNLH